ncbi:dual specificity protein phosphatase family protein [Endozoicomonadaceae bacterium StTr2]
MPVGLPPSARTLTAAITSLGRKIQDTAARVGKWLNRLVRRQPAERSEIQAGQLSMERKRELLEHIKMVEPDDKWIQSRQVSKLNDLLTHDQYALLDRAMDKQNPDLEAAQKLYTQIRREAPGLAALLINTITANDKRTNEWAQPFPQPGMINSYKLDDKMFRCAQPDKVVLERLEKEGYHVINLRHFHSDFSVVGRDDFAGSHFKVPTKTPKPFVAGVMREIHKQQKLGKKIYIHCLHGSDRTGFMCAAYRMVFQGWTANQAIDEYTKGSFGYHEKVFPELPGMLKELEENKDIEKIQKELGLVPKSGVEMPGFRQLAIEQAKKNPNIPGGE